MLRAGVCELPGSVSHLNWQFDIPRIESSGQMTTFAFNVRFAMVLKNDGRVRF